MNANLTHSVVDRQNILNNPDFLKEIQEYLGISGMIYEDEMRFTTAQIADFYGVSTKTIKRYIENEKEELSHNGYCVLKGAKLKEFKTLFGYLIYADIDTEENLQKDMNVSYSEDLKVSERDINVPLRKKSNRGRDISVPTPKQLTDKQLLRSLYLLGIFNFRALLNIGMLLTESEKAKSIRSAILDIVIDSLNKKLGGSTKFINQRDEDYLVAMLREPEYRKEYTSALSRYLEMGDAKYSIYTDAIYQAIFDENAAEYKQILKLEAKENPRETMYAEILKLIASFEIGIADEMKIQFEKLGRKLTPIELNHYKNTFMKMSKYSKN